VTFALRELVATEAAPTSLPMPDQSFRAAFRDPAAPGLQSPRQVQALRALVLGLPLSVTLALGWLSLGWFALDGRLTLAEGALVLVTGFAFYWVVLSVGTAALGLAWRPRAPEPPPCGLTVAILLPMYGEPAAEVIGTAVRLLSALQGRGPHRFALHVLSDTRDPGKAALEGAVVAGLRRAHPGLALAYRRRDRNTDYKSGNIRDWVQTQGAAHEAMLILDADSVMGAETVLQMADRLAQEPGLGLIQTVPRVLPGHTVWQGLQSFASEVYGVNMGRGFALWAGVTGNFLGHNALVRTRAFAAAAGLPHLPGQAPRGGVILSHDFVEAALLRRAGWGVALLPEAEASFEDTPETLTGYLRRDRRWCQGNLQHLRLLATPGLNPVSRFHLLQGAMAYLSSVWWLALLILWAVPGQGGAMPDLFAQNPFLPTWPDRPPVTQGALAAFVGLMLVAPKLLGLVGYLSRQGLPRGQAPRFAGMMLAEMAVSALIAPALMLHQVRSVLGVVLGRDGGWIPHVAGRSDLGTLLRFHGVETALGLGLLTLAVAGQLSLWLVPIAASLCLTVPVAALVQLPRSALRLRRTRPSLA
jgi:membrane glycosyltransferase